jgi:hypothetical protein
MRHGTSLHRQRSDFLTMKDSAELLHVHSDGMKKLSHIIAPYDRTPNKPEECDSLHPTWPA